MAGADFNYQNTDFREDETFEFSVEWEEEDDDGTVTAFPFDEYTFEYRLTSLDGCSPSVELTSGNGITIDAANNRITFAAATMPRAGRYQHSCLATHTATGKKRAPFGGIVVIHEAN